MGCFFNQGFCVRQENVSAFADSEKLTKQPVFLEVKNSYIIFKKEKILWENIQAVKQYLDFALICSLHLVLDPKFC